MSYTDLGNGQGRIYATKSGTIHLTELNRAEGLRLMKDWALKSRALGLGQRGTFTIEIGTITGSGNVTQVLVNAVDQINGSIAYDTGEENDLAAAIAAAINSTTPVNGPGYAAVVSGNIVVGYAPYGAPTSINGHTVAVSNTGNITITETDVGNIPDQTVPYSTTHGYQFFVDSSVSAPADSISGAEEVTKYIVPRTLDGALPNVTDTLVDGKADVERNTSISFIRLNAESGNSDDCIAINPVGYADNDLVYVSGFDENNAITFTEDANGNLELKDNESFLSTGTGTWILFQHRGGTFYEIMRASSAQGLISITYGQGLAAISAGTIVPGAQYLITDRGHRGLILTGVTTNRFSLEGQFIAAVPDYQNTTGNFIGDWHSGLTLSVGKICAYGAGLQYVNTTGTNTATNPASDTTNWTLLDRATSTDYVVEVHFVRFNYNDDRVVFRSDDRGNEVTLSDTAKTSFSAVAGVDNLDFFWWGNDNVNGNILIDSAINRNIFSNINIFNQNKMEKVYLSSNLSESAMSRWFFNCISSLQSSTLSVFNYDLAVSTSAMPSFFRYNRVKLSNGTPSLTLSLSNSGRFTHSNIDIGITTTLTITSPVEYCDINLKTKPNAIGAIVASIDSNIDGRFVLASGESDFDISITNTGNTDLDLEDVDIYGDIEIVSANATEDLESISNISSCLSQIIIRPESGLVLTIKGTDIGSVADTDIVIPPSLADDSSPSGGFAGSVTLDGDKTDYAVLKIVRTGNESYFVVEKVVQF